MLKRWIDEITNLDNVKGVFVASLRGKVIESQGLDLDTYSMEQIAGRLLRMVAIMDETTLTGDIELFWEDKFVICKASHNILLVAICDKASDLAMLRITINVNLSHILQNKKIAKIAKIQTPHRAHVLKKGKFGEDELKLLSSI